MEQESIHELEGTISTGIKKEQPNYLELERMRLYQEVFRLLTIKASEFIVGGSEVIDLACGNGLVENIIDVEAKGCSIRSVDADANILNRLESRKEKLKNTKIKTIQGDAREYLISNQEPADVIICTTALHEMIDPEKQEDDLKSFLAAIRQNLQGPLNIAILGDYYFSPDVSNEEFTNFMEKQALLYGHKDDRQSYINPEIVKRKASEVGLSLLDESDIQTVPELNRRYFLFIFSR